MSPGCVTTVCVCDPRHVCTLATSFGALRLLMSKIRTPRTRSLLTGSGTPPNPQSVRLMFDSDDMTRRFLKIDTSFCDAGHVYVCTITGFAGFEMSKISNPL